MNKNDFIAAGKAAFGSTWQTDMSKALGVSDRTLRRWISGDSKLPSLIAADIQRVLSDRKNKINRALKMTTEKFLMNPLTGSVDTEENWLSEMRGWDEDLAECQRQFDTLIEVTKNESGDWMEKE